MTSYSADSLSLESVLNFLKSFTCLTPPSVTTEAEKAQLRQAIQQVVSLSEWENLGICADNLTIAWETLNRYLVGLGYPSLKEIPPETAVLSGVYLKYNSQKQSYYLDSYTGDYRGVLLSCQGENETVTGTYGYFPLDLF